MTDIQKNTLLYSVYVIKPRFFGLLQGAMTTTYPGQHTIWHRGQSHPKGEINQLII